MLDNLSNLRKFSAGKTRPANRNAKPAKSKKTDRSTLAGAIATYRGRLAYLQTIAVRIAETRKRVVLLVALPFILGALIYAVAATKQYVSTTYIYIDPRGVQADGSHQSGGDFAIAANLVESQVELIGSERIAKAVLSRLGAERANEMASLPLLTRLAGLVGLGSTGPDQEEERVRTAIYNLDSRLTVKREPMTFVIAISYESQDPSIAKQVSQAFADAYIEDLLNSAKQSNKLASDWLKDSLEGLREQAEAADRALEDFRAKPGAADPVMLNDLESRSQVSRVTYESFLRRFTDIVQQQSFPMTDARIASEASIPEAIGPRKTLVLVVALLLGALLGLAISFLLEIESESRKPQELASVN